MAIDHYSKWREIKLVKEYIVIVVAKFMEEEIIYKFGVLKYVLTNNGGEQMVEFDMLCKNYGIIQQFTTP